MKPQAQVREYLAKANMKPYHLARSAGVPVSTLYKWLKSEANLSLDQWLRIERFVGNRTD